jgi:hypothetical protein
MQGRNDAPATLVAVLLQRCRASTTLDIFQAPVLAAQEAAGERVVDGDADPWRWHTGASSLSNGSLSMRL